MVTERSFKDFSMKRRWVPSGEAINNEEDGVDWGVGGDRRIEG